MSMCLELARNTLGVFARETIDNDTFFWVEFNQREDGVEGFFFRQYFITEIFTIET